MARWVILRPPLRERCNTYGDITTYATAISNISGGGSSGKYQLLDRVKDDSNNEIGTVSGFFTDANDVEYAVVCLDAQYRLANGYLCSNASTAITGLTQYQDQTVYTSKDTATSNTQKILDFCDANSYTSTGCSHCRSKSFIIDGVTYYGQYPNLVETIDITKNLGSINSADTSAASNPTLVIDYKTKDASNQYSAGKVWCINGLGYISAVNIDGTGKIYPVLEIPNT